MQTISIINHLYLVIRHQAWISDHWRCILLEGKRPGMRRKTNNVCTKSEQSDTPSHYVSFVTLKANPYIDFQLYQIKLHIVFNSSTLKQLYLKANFTINSHSKSPSPIWKANDQEWEERTKNVCTKWEQSGTASHYVSFITDKGQLLNWIPTAYFLPYISIIKSNYVLHLF